MSKQSGFMKALEIERERRDAEVRYHARVFTLDMVTIALGRLGWREGRFEKFNDMLAKVSQEYAEDILSDAKDDKEMWHSKDSLDRELKQYVGKNFVPYDERYK